MAHKNSSCPKNIKIAKNKPVRPAPKIKSSDVLIWKILGILKISTLSAIGTRPWELKIPLASKSRDRKAKT